MSFAAAVPFSEAAIPASLFTRPTFLMCPPEWYDVEHVMNPWMAGQQQGLQRDVAFRQWRTLYEQLRRVADVRLLPAEPECPDMTFLAHGALVQGSVAALASFAHSERRTETGFLRAWLEDNGFTIWDTPPETAFEGEGDAVFSPDGHTLWAAHGNRTSQSAHRHVAGAWHARVRPLTLTDPRFYHLDTCFSLLSGGFVLYAPEAFDRASLDRIEAAFDAEHRLLVCGSDAVHLACGPLCVGKTVLIGQVSRQLVQTLERAGFDVCPLELGEFLKGGGGAHSLALRLSDPATTLVPGELVQ